MTNTALTSLKPIDGEILSRLSAAGTRHGFVPELLVAGLLLEDLGLLNQIAQDSPGLKVELDEQKRVKKLGIILACVTVRLDKPNSMGWLADMGVDVLGAKRKTTYNLGTKSQPYETLPVMEACLWRSKKVLTLWADRYGTDFLRKPTGIGFTPAAVLAKTGMTEMLLHLLSIAPGVIDDKVMDRDKERTLEKSAELSGQAGVVSVLRSWRAQQAAQGALREMSLTAGSRP